MGKWLADTGLNGGRKGCLMGGKVGGWVRSGVNRGASDGLVVGWAEVGKWKMVDKWRKCQIGENIDR